MCDGREVKPMGRCWKNLCSALPGRTPHKESHDGTSIVSYQRLIENMRERNAEKDALIEHLRDCYRSQRESYEKRLADYNMEVASLQAALKRKKKRKSCRSGQDS